MAGNGLQARLDALLGRLVTDGGFGLALVCTDLGLPLAVAGSAPRGDDLGALVGVFDDVVRRAIRDLAVAEVDELTLRDGGRRRIVLRPLHPTPEQRLFLVVEVPRDATWRRLTNRACSALEDELAEICAAGALP